MQQTTLAGTWPAGKVPPYQLCVIRTLCTAIFDAAETRIPASSCHIPHSQLPVWNVRHNPPPQINPSFPRSCQFGTLDITPQINPSFPRSCQFGTLDITPQINPSFPRSCQFGTLDITPQINPSFPRSCQFGTLDITPQINPSFPRCLLTEPYRQIPKRVFRDHTQNKQPSVLCTEISPPPFSSLSIIADTPHLYLLYL